MTNDPVDDWEDPPEHSFCSVVRAIVHRNLFHRTLLIIIFSTQAELHRGKVFDLVLTAQFRWRTRAAVLN